MLPGKPTDMKLTKADLKDRDKGMGATVAPSNDGPKYPWGLEVRLDKLSLGKLGMTKDLPDVGVLCQVTAVARITAVSERESQSGKDCDVTIQIERMTLAVEDEDEAFEKGAKKGKTSAHY